MCVISVQQLSSHFFGFLFSYLPLLFFFFSHTEPKVSVAAVVLLVCEVHFFPFFYIVLCYGTINSLDGGSRRTRYTQDPLLLWLLLLSTLVLGGS